MKDNRPEIGEMRRLINTLSEASHEYYQNDKQIMTDKKYDELYDRLCALEAETGIVLSQSVTQRVGSEVVSGLIKVPHKFKLLSLDKTKETEKLKSFLASSDGQPAVLSWKLDGLTVVLNYKDGKLVQAITRGNGELGEDITHNARCFKNIPLKINYKGEIYIRGEAVIFFSEFEKINSNLPDEAKYKNPRNLTSGTVRQLKSDEALKRNVMFFAFSLMQNDGAEISDSKIETLHMLSGWGFDVVESERVTSESIEQAVLSFKEKIAENDFATDGLVLTFDSVSYSASLGVTSKFPKDSIAFKWADDIAETTLKDIEWNTSRTGLINPVAVFEEVELEGTTVSRASIHNVSIMRELELGTGDTITVYKANMIIPQIHDNFTRSNSLIPPEKCPACGGATEIKALREQEALFCINEACIAKSISFLEHFVSRNAMNIEGLSVSTIEKFVERGYIHNYTDFYKLEQYFDEIKALEGFGEKSVKNIESAVEKSKTLPLHNFIFALGISNVGLSNAKLLCAHFGYDFDKIINAEYDELSSIKGFGETIALSLVNYFSDGKNLSYINEMRNILVFNNPELAGTDEQNALNGSVVVITGDLNLFENRNALKEKIESLGGKVTGSVSAKTNYLINNDIFSSSSKNKKAKELGVEIVSEQDFSDRFFR